MGINTNEPAEVDAAFVDLVRRIGLGAEWALGGSALLAQHDGADGSWPAVEPSRRTSAA